MVLRPTPYGVRSVASSLSLLIMLGACATATTDPVEFEPSAGGAFTFGGSVSNGGTIVSSNGGFTFGGTPPTPTGGTPATGGTTGGVPSGGTTTGGTIGSGGAQGGSGGTAGGGSAGTASAGSAGTVAGGGTAGTAPFGGLAGTGGTMTGGSGGGAGTSGSGGKASAGSGGGGAGATGNDSCDWSKSACMSLACDRACPQGMGDYCQTACGAIITCIKANPGCGTASDPMCVNRAQNTGSANKCTSEWEGGGGGSDPLQPPAQAATDYFNCACGSGGGT